MPGAPTVVATNVCVIDCDTDDILYAKNPNATGNPASTTKLMTCLLACEDGTLTDNITVNSSYFTDGGLGSNAGLDNGDVLTLQELIGASLFRSANDASDIIAEYIGRTVYGGAAGSAAQSAFYAEMNAKAAALGMTNSNFLSAHGFYTAGGHVSTPYDICLLSRAASENAALAGIYAAEFIYDTAGGYYWNNTQSGRYAGITIGKLGSIVGFERSLGAVLERSTYRFAAGLLTPYASTSEQGMWDDSMRPLLDYALKTVGEFGEASMLLFWQNIGLTYSAGWSDTSYAPTQFRHGFGKVASVNTAVATCQFTGSSVEFYAPTSNNVGIIDIWVDGVLTASVDQYSPTLVKEVMQWSYDFGEPGEHELLFIPQAAKNPSSSGVTVRFDYLIIDDYVPAVQFSRPASDVSSTNWITSTGSGTKASHIDELIPDDADYIYTETDDAIVEVAIQSLTDPAVGTGHVIHYKAKSPFADDVLVSLYQGATLIEEWTQALTTSYAEYSHTLGTTEANAISNYGDLRLRFKAMAA